MTDPTNLPDPDTTPAASRQQLDTLPVWARELVLGLMQTVESERRRKVRYREAAYRVGDLLERVLTAVEDVIDTDGGDEAMEQLRETLAEAKGN